jgi:hypothetical protein
MKKIPNLPFHVPMVAVPNLPVSVDQFFLVQKSMSDVKMVLAETSLVCAQC